MDLPSWRSNTSQQPRLSGHPLSSRSPARSWQVGEVAFLKKADEFSQTERAELLASGRVHSRATGHPVIVLDRSADSKYYIITTVSAYSSGEDNNYLPPWKQAAHRRKNPNSFRAFVGSASPNGIKHLRLADNKQWPKPKTSWVYIQNPFLVPSSTLITYTKSRHQLRMAPDSLQDLLGVMDSKCLQYQQQKIELKLKGGCSGPVVEAYQQPWRRGNNKATKAPCSQPPSLTEKHPGGSSNTVAQSSPPLYSDIASKRTGLTDITKTAVNQPSWSTVAAKGAAKVTSATCQAEGRSFPQRRRKQTAVPA
ncbi:hypothetical protein HD806DRAFT_547510 [Xylariaceae sp. AK1471]|nr:hypothetical protein HD806DRAFT_547510 [Xylariaceae sp. AK1471]